MELAIIFVLAHAEGPELDSRAFLQLEVAGSGITVIPFVCHVGSAQIRVPRVAPVWHSGLAAIYWSDCQTRHTSKREQAQCSAFMTSGFSSSRHCCSTSHPDPTRPMSPPVACNWDGGAV